MAHTTAAPRRLAPVTVGATAWRQPSRPFDVAIERENHGLAERTARTRVARRHRECLDKYLPRVKIFEYASDGGHK